MIFGIESKLAFCNCEDYGGVGVWMELTGHSGPYSDVTFHEGMLFALCNSRLVETWDFNGDHPLKIMEIKSSFPRKSAEAAKCFQECLFYEHILDRGSR